MNLAGRVARAALLAGGALGLAACAGSLLGRRAPPVAYELSAHAGARGPRIAADLKVLTPLVRAGLDTDRIAASYPDRRLDHFSGARWSAPLDETIEQLAVQEFRARSALRNVVPEASALHTRYWLEIEVVAFQARYPAGGGAPTIEAHFVARLGDVRGGTTLARIDARVARPAAANRMTAIVAAFEAAADRALDRIVAATDRRLAGRAGAPL
ncbi:MAG TPA: ABC-type transport auxiliary lipoprotein family protein [Steroidobacteraceae bacterium]|nr:ABC-type transport auxiliary lipoprotein family protein [Steroidobacteraceae bacterium]